MDTVTRPPERFPVPHYLCFARCSANSLMMNSATVLRSFRSVSTFQCAPAVRRRHAGQWRKLNIVSLSAGSALASQPPPAADAASTNSLIESIQSLFSDVLRSAAAAVKGLPSKLESPIVAIEHWIHAGPCTSSTGLLSLEQKIMSQLSVSSRVVRIAVIIAVAVLIALILLMIVLKTISLARNRALRRRRSILAHEQSERTAAAQAELLKAQKLGATGGGAGVDLGRIDDVMTAFEVKYTSPLLERMTPTGAALMELESVERDIAEVERGLKQKERRVEAIQASRLEKLKEVWFPAYEPPVVKQRKEPAKQEMDSEMILKERELILKEIDELGAAIDAVEGMIREKEEERRENMGVSKGGGDWINVDAESEDDGGGDRVDTDQAGWDEETGKLQSDLDRFEREIDAQMHKLEQLGAFEAKNK